MTESSNHLIKFKKLEKPYKNTIPCIINKDTIIEIPQNLPEGTEYDIGIKPNDITDQLSLLKLINKKLNTIIEIQHFILFEQIPEILQEIQEKQDKNTKPITIELPYSWR